MKVCPKCGELYDESIPHKCTYGVNTECLNCGTMTTKLKCPKCGTLIVSKQQASADPMKYNMMNEQFKQTKYLRNIYILIAVEIIGAVIAGIIWLIVYCYTLATV